MNRSKEDILLIELLARAAVYPSTGGGTDSGNPLG